MPVKSMLTWIKFSLLYAWVLFSPSFCSHALPKHPLKRRRRKKKDLEPAAVLNEQTASILTP